MTLLQQLVKKGILEKEQASVLEYEVKTSRKKEEELILEKRIVSENFLFNLKSEMLKIPLKKISPDDISLKALEIIPQESANYYQMIPLAKKDNILEVGMVYPEDIKAKEALEFLCRQIKLSYQIFLICPSDFKSLFKKYKTIKGEVSRALEELETELQTEKTEEKLIPLTEFERMAEEAPISKVVAVFLRHAVEGNASDIHIEPTKEKIRVRFRLDGVLHSSIFLPLKILPAIVSRIKILANLKIDENRMPQDGRFTAKIGSKEVDFRVSTFPTVLGEKVAMRVLDPEKAIVDIDMLGIKGRNFNIIEKAIKKPFGMILVTGPTGCGKTTTLYALLRILNKEGVNIITLEDPIEYSIEGINQSQIKPEIGYDFATGLRFVLRQDPDILMAGEIRDNETASLAIHIALTGHLFLSTIHTTNAIGVIPRLIDMGIAPYLIPPTLSIAIAQRLVRKLCVDCRRKIKPKKEIEDLILEELENLPETIKEKINIYRSLYIYEAVGCKKCNETGYLNRIGIFETLEMTDRLSEIILKEPSETKIKEEAQRQGMITMKQDGILKVLEGVTSIEELLRVAEEK